MDLLLFIFMAVILITSDGLIVHGPSGPLVASVGSSVVLTCYVDEFLLMEGLKVEWRRTDSETLVHLYQEGESRPEAQQQEYHDRANFFTDQIQHGNFSLRLDKLRAEDEGNYRCKVYSRQDSGQTVAQIKDVERLLVSGSDESISASVGEDVTLNCSVDSHITPEHIEEVSWIRTDEDILVLLYQKNKTFPDSSDERYRERVEFFADEIPKGNFSLRLKSVRIEDKGVYMCQVFAGGASANATVVLEQLSFSVSHIVVFILCISASGSAFLLCCLIYCRTSKNGFLMQHMYYKMFHLENSVVLSCHVDKRLLQRSLKVEWRRKDNNTLVHLYQDGESRPEAQQQDYHDRAHFFTDQIQHGNFSLRLDNLRAEDEGQYICKVYSQQNCVYSAETRLDGALRIASELRYVPVGGEAVLSYRVDKHFLPNNLKVEWRRKDSEALVHLYQDGESRPEAQQQDYHGRAHFFTDEIQHGNFSLRLDNLRAVDKGIYRCIVYSDEDCVFSVETEVVLSFAVKTFCHTLAPLRGSMVLPYYSDNPIPTNNIKVEWKRPDSENLVHLYQDGESRPERQQKDYHCRANFFTDQIQHGNFSLRLKKLRAKDEGKYICKIYRGFEQLFSARTNLELNEQGFLMEHINLHIFHLGSSVVFPCHVDKLLLMEGLRVEWRRTDSETLVHLYQDGESQPETQQPDYYDRANFFTDQIQHGNFSLCLDNLRAEDKGKYTCNVYRDQHCVFSAETYLAICFSIKIATGLQFVHEGDSAVLPCQVDSHLLPNILKVEWKRTDSETLVHLYQDGESRPEAQHQDYRGRAHFFTDQIQHGNFSLHLDNLRAEDKGIYRCKVYSDQGCLFSAEAEVVLEFSVRSIYLTPATLGSSVVLPYYVYKPLPTEDLKVEWTRPDSEILVHLYQDGESRPEAQQEYHDRAHFFTDQIQHGNFSLHLDKLTAEDEGEYTCTVYENQKQVCFAKTNLKLREQETVFRLQMFLVFFPNIIMFLAFIFWGISEGALYETVSCCALYVLRPLMLLCAAPYIDGFTSDIKAWIQIYSYRTQYGVFSTVVYAVLFKSVLDKSAYYERLYGVMIVVLVVMVLLFILLYIIWLSATFIWESMDCQRIVTLISLLANISFNVLPSLQFLLLIYRFGYLKKDIFPAFVAVLPVLVLVAQYKWDITCRKQMGCSPLIRRSAWLNALSLVNAIMFYYYKIALENEKDFFGWIFMIFFLQALWALVNFTTIFKWDIHRTVPVYLLGSVIVVLLNSFTLMTELILTAVNGHGAVGDLRITVFSSEFIFTLCLLVFTIFEPWTKLCVQSYQKAKRPLQSCWITGSGFSVSAAEPGPSCIMQETDANTVEVTVQNQNTAELYEMNPLLNKDQKAGT